MRAKSIILSALTLTLALPASAGEADVVDVDIRPNPDGTFFIAVTVQHADEGWDHYADAWQVVAPNGDVLATRVLAHPHVTEQPFTRFLSAVEIPADVTEVTVRARDSVHGLGGETLTVTVPRQ
ncbi:MAG: hypothetical protein AAGJ29_00565 [Pseudomonadota bacterium]